MRLALLVTDHQLGGTPLRLARLARALRDRGVTVSYGCLSEPGPISDAVRREGIEVFACGAQRARDVGALRRLGKSLRAFRPDVVHASLFHANLAARWVGRRLKLPVLTSTATIEVERPWHNRLERWTAGWDQGHIVTSRSLQEHAVQKFGRKPEAVFVVPPLIREIAHWERNAALDELGLPHDKLIIAWYGRFDPVKRVEWLVEAAAQTRDLPLQFAIAGMGPGSRDLSKKVRTKTVSDRVKLLDWQQDPSALLAAADLLIFPSLTEGTPNTVLEAMSAGVPVIAFDLPIMRELGGNSERILLAPTADVRGLVAGLRTMHADRNRRAAIGRAASEWIAAEFSTTKSCDASLAVYEQTIAEYAALRDSKTRSRKAQGVDRDQ